MPIQKNSATYICIYITQCRPDQSYELVPEINRHVTQTFRIQRAHVVSLIRVERTHLDLVLQGGVWILVKEHLVDGHVKGRDDLLGVADQLAVERGVKLLQVVAVEVQEWIANRVDLQLQQNHLFFANKAG